jgi:hypothetical protein
LEDVSDFKFLEVTSVLMSKSLISLGKMLLSLAMRNFQLIDFIAFVIHILGYRIAPLSVLASHQL